MKEERFLKNIDKNFLLTFFNQKHKELSLQYQILTTALFSISIGFGIGYATGQIESKSPNIMIVLSLLCGLTGFIGITIIFDHYFKILKYKILSIGELKND